MQERYSDIKREKMALLYLTDRQAIIREWADEMRKGLLNVKEGLQMEYVEPFSLRDMAGEHPLQQGEYVTAPATAELALMGLGDGRALKGKKVLYVGIGTAEVPKRLKSLGVDCFSLDNSKDIAIRSHQLKNTTMYGDAARNPYPSNMFERVILKNVLNASEDLEKIVREALRVCAPGGRVAIYPVLAFVNVDKPNTIPGVTFIQWGPDLFTAEITKDSMTDNAAVKALFDADSFALKPVRYETTQKRLRGYYVRQILLK